MKERPKLKLELTQADKVVEIISWAFNFAVWGLTIINYQRLPDIIPTSYNENGAQTDLAINR